MKRGKNKSDLDKLAEQETDRALQLAGVSRIVEPRLFPSVRSEFQNSLRPLPISIKKSSFARKRCGIGKENLTKFN